MTSAIPNPALSTQSALAVIAEDQVIFVRESLCKPKPHFQLPVEVNSSFVKRHSCSNLPEPVAKPLTCASSGSLVPVVIETVMSPCKSSFLSPDAQPFLLNATCNPCLYPAGEDKLGRAVVTDENSTMHLDYFEVEPDPPDEVLLPPATADIKDVKKLRSWEVKLPCGQEFFDRVLPPASSDVTINKDFPPEYFLELHKRVRLGGTYNFAGSRIRLEHSFINIEKFRLMLQDYDDLGILQLLEFGFPVGLSQDFELKSSTQNHSSSYEFYTYLDQFFTKEVALRGIAGPLINAPFPSTMISPLMTAIKKPSSRRPVFDASFGDLSINNNTPEKEYLDLGIVESEKKALPPSSTMVFLGVEFDTVEMCMRVSSEKRFEVKATVNGWYRRTVATKQELQSLQGQLMWISKVVRFSRVFVIRIIAEQKALKSQKQKKTLSYDLKKDLLWWKLFLDVFNGVELIIPQTVFCNFLGDAMLAGGGAWNEMSNQYWSRKFPFTMQSPDIPIHLKEFYILIISVKIWGHFWAGKRVALHCDNSSVVETINHQKPKDAQMQQCLREFLFHVTTMKFEPVMVRIPTHENSLADFVSRNHNKEDIKKEFSRHGMEAVEEILVNDDMFFFTADW